MKPTQIWERQMAYAEQTIRQLLIDSCHSSQEAEAFFSARLTDAELLGLLMEIARDAGDHQGDAPMQAAYWLSQYPDYLLIPYEPLLLEMLPIVDGYGGHIALALGRIGSARGREAIIQGLGDGSRFDAWLFREGLEIGKGRNED